MKFYNVFSGFLTGSTRDAYMRNIGDNLFNSLHSYWYLKDQSDEKILQGFAITKGNIMIDSGAFTAYADAKMKRQTEEASKKAKKPLDIDEYVEKYIEWINKWDKYVTVFGQMDVIPTGEKSYKELDECCKQTWDNFVYMTNKVNCPEKILYTYHFGEPIKWLEKALQYKLPNGQPLQYIAIGGLVGRSTKDRTAFLDQCFNLICNPDGTPKLKVHGFGVSSSRMWKRYPFESCDSFTPGMNANHGFTYDKFGACQIEDKHTIFKRRGNTIEEQAELDRIEAEKDEEVLTAESLERVENKAKLLISNIKHWDDLAENIKEHGFKPQKTLWDNLF